MVLAAPSALEAAVEAPPERERGGGQAHTPTQGGVRAPSALAIDASGQPVPTGRQLCPNSQEPAAQEPAAWSSAGAPQPQHRLQLVHIQQPTHSEEGCVPE